MRLWAGGASRLRQLLMGQARAINFDGLISPQVIRALIGATSDKLLIIGRNDAIIQAGTTIISAVTEFLRVTGAYAQQLGWWLLGADDSGTKVLGKWDGTTWTDLAANIATIPLIIVWDGVWFWIGQTGGNIHRYDGTVWEDMTAVLGFVNDITAACVGGGYLFVGATDGTLKRYDLTTGAVTDLTAALGATSIDVLFYNTVSGEVVAVHSGGSIASSADAGATWTDRTIAGFTAISGTVRPDTGEMAFGDPAGGVRLVSSDWTTITDITDRFAL